MILILQHISIEGAGTLGRFLKSARKRVKTIELWKGNKLPGDFADVEAIIVLGGPMNVYEEDRYPFLKEEDIFLKAALKKNTPLLGICLGVQLLAKSCGAKVKKAEHKEIGWHKVRLTDAGIWDPLFAGLDKELEVFQWHEDTFEVPDGAVLLAASGLCRNQAFRFGKNAYGLQFHVEVTDKEISDWFEEYNVSPQLNIAKTLIDYFDMRDKFNKQANLMYLNFSRLIGPDALKR